jgi:hypothetical protein
MSRDYSKIRNYTTNVPANRTIQEMEQMLATLGASSIMKNMRTDGKTEAMMFKYKDRGYMLPANLDKCAQVLEEQGQRGRGRIDQFDDYVYRVSWRVLHDWLDSQISLIKIGNADVEQVMLPYMWDGKQTLYDKFKHSNFILTDNTK